MQHLFTLGTLAWKGQTLPGTQCPTCKPAGMALAARTPSCSCLTDVQDLGVQGSWSPLPTGTASTHWTMGILSREQSLRTWTPQAAGPSRMTGSQQASRQPAGRCFQFPSWNTTGCVRSWPQVTPDLCPGPAEVNRRKKKPESNRWMAAQEGGISSHGSGAERRCWPRPKAPRSREQIARG